MYIHIDFLNARANSDEFMILENFTTSKGSARIVGMKDDNAHKSKIRCQKSFTNMSEMSRYYPLVR